MPKKKVYLLQVNTPTDRNLLPLAIGLIASYAKSQPELNENYDFSLEFLRNRPEDMVKSFSEPDVIGFACYSWNTKHSFEIARLAKEKWPRCLTVMGGPSTPMTKEELQRFTKLYGYIDVFVHGEGEITFSNILLARLQNQQLNSVKGITFTDKKSPDGLTFTGPIQKPEELNQLPSPFLNGTFDKLISEHGKHITGTLWETNRGCPYSCTFCFWGQVQKSKIRTFDMERLRAEIKWMSSNRISYIYSADANFGILQRDSEIAKMLADSCKESGYPKFFMINWAKHSNQKVFEIAQLLKEGGIGFRITLSRQSFNPETLKAVKRVNTTLPEFYAITKQANSYGYSTYTDLILGLPLESYDSFVTGLQNVLQPYQNYHYSIYLCRLLTGSEMSYPEYLKRYQIETRSCKVEMGRRETTDSTIEESENLIVSTSTMPLEDWKRLYTFCYLTIPIYNYRLAFFVLNYLKYEHGAEILDALKFMVEKIEKEQQNYSLFAKALNVITTARDSILNNGSSVVKAPGTGSIKWEPYEAALLTLLSDKKKLFEEIWLLVKAFIEEKKLPVTPDVLKEVLTYQMATIPTWGQPNKADIEFSYDIPQYFDALNIQGTSVGITRKKSKVRFGDEKDTWKDALSFATSRLEGGHTFKILKRENVSEGC